MLMQKIPTVRTLRPAARAAQPNSRERLLYRIRATVR